MFAYQATARRRARLVSPESDEGGSDAPYLEMWKLIAKKFLKHFRWREALKFNGFVPRFVAAHQFDAATGATHLPGQQSNQGFVRGGVHGRRGHFVSQFGPQGPADFVGGSARLQFH